MRRTEEAVGRAATRRGRERLALQKVVNDTGMDAEDLKYVEDQKSGTSKVIKKSGGEVQGRFSW